jgi:endonuclease YncB( thermonuclease family)
VLRPLLIALLALPLAAPTGALASTEYATVPHKGGVNDGDTIDVTLHGRREHVRFIGVQAAELTRYSVTPSKWRGECHAVASARFVLKMIKRGHYRVRLTSQTQKSDTIGRLERSVAVKIGGRWRDIGAMEMSRGLTLWLHNTNETIWNARYNELGQLAAQRGIGFFDPTACGSGPAQDVPFKVWVMSDPIGDDTQDKNSEYVRIQNLGSHSVSLYGWWLSDAGKKPLRYHFPRGTSIAAGDFITVRTGHGTNGGGTYYRGLDGTQFENSVNGGGAGDGAYLFDPQGDNRAWMIYPCLVACSDPNQGALRVTANAIRGPEYALVKNVSNHPISLFGYELRLPGAYGFGPDAALDPGETMQVYVEGDPSNDTRLVKHIGYDHAYLVDRGGTAQVTTFDEIVLGCDSWGDAHC